MRANYFYPVIEKVLHPNLLSPSSRTVICPVWNLDVQFSNRTGVHLTQLQRRRRVQRPFLTPGFYEYLSFAASGPD